ncbi:MAG: glycosyl hydrolase [Acidobacteriota bacterium]
MRSVVVLFFVSLLPIVASAQWIKQNVNTTASLRGLSVVNEKIVWASGTGGTVIRTIDGGKTWNVIIVPGAEKLDFRDAEAFDANTAYILSIGNGESSRIYKTTDGGTTWKLQFTNKNEKAFFDAIACWDKNNCIAMSDPVDNKFLLIKTADGTRWSPIDTSKMPPTLEGEAAFAASGTCLITQGNTGAFLVSGGSGARVFRSKDRGHTWAVAETPVAKGAPGSGIFSIAMRDSKNGVIVGGNYEKPEESVNNFAVTSDGGQTWILAEALSGYRSGVTYIDSRSIVAVGTSGADVLKKGKPVWGTTKSESFNSVQSKSKDAVWAVGPNGGVFRYVGAVTVTLTD